MKRLYLVLSLLVLTVALVFSATSVAMGANLVVNGDFESANPTDGITTDYTFLNPATTGAWTLGPPYMFTVGTNPGLYHSGWLPGFTDHSATGTKMMIVNGTTDGTLPNKLVWGQTVPVTPPTTAETVYPLWAGQNWQVGEVHITNSGDKICVEYVVFPQYAALGWRLTEAHLAIAPTINGIPQTKTGNPIPGEFTYARTYDPGVTSDKFCIDRPAGWTTGMKLFIAAHAVVNKPSTSHMEYGSFCVTSGAQTKLGDAVTPATLAWEHPGWDPNLRDAATDAPSDLGSKAEWVWDAYLCPTPRDGDLANLYQEFQLPDGATITSGQLRIAADNAFSWKLNAGAFTDVNLLGDWRNQSVFGLGYVPDPNITAWKKVYTYDVTGQLSPLANALYVTSVNAAWETDDPTVNPSGVIWALCGEWEKEASDNNSANDTAWGGEKDFRGKNWSHYMEYTIGDTGPAEYLFSVWGASSYPANPAQLQISINGTVLGQLDLTSTPGGWVNFTAPWSPGSATSALIEIRDLRLEYMGDDFVLDDISLVPTP